MISVNLIPDTLLLIQTRRRHMKGWALSALAAGCVLAVSFGIDWTRRLEAAELHEQSHRLQTQLTRTRTELRSLTNRANQALSQLERARALRAKRRWSSLLTMIARRMPEGCWLTSIATDPATPKPVPVRPASRRPAPDVRRSETAVSASTVIIQVPRKLKITGYATTPAEPHAFVTALKDSGAFTNVALERLLREPMLDGFYFRFDLVCEW